MSSERSNTNEPRASGGGGGSGAGGDRAPKFRYTAQLAGEIETRWHAEWEKRGSFRVSNPSEAGFVASRPKFFCMDMFPYPSGAGLHVGHPEGYTATDIICRYRRMKGFNVLHPMGWDAFGLPAEQYAIQTGVHPAITTRKAIDNFRRQLKRFGFSYDWSREFATIDPDYYKWTQWLFLRIYDSWYDKSADRARPISELIDEWKSGSRPFELNPDAAEYSGAGSKPGVRAKSWNDADRADRHLVLSSWRLAYIAETTVNWCPKLGTALANEEVIDGKSERGGFPVLRKPLKQWMFRITAYAERLLRDLDGLDWPTSTRVMQQEWIGRSEGAYIDFPAANRRIRVFTTRPDTVFGATFMVLAPEHPMVEALAGEKYGDTVPRAWKGRFPGADELIARGGGATPGEMIAAYRAYSASRSDVERQSEAKEKTGVFIGAYAINPLNDARIPIFIADYVLMGYGTGAIMAVPAQDERDWAFAKAFELPIVRTVRPPEGFGDKPYTGDGLAMNSRFLDGLPMTDAKAKIIDWLQVNKFGRRRVNYRLRDWLFSRQRYWGEPFPIVFDAQGLHYGIAESKLPLALPELIDYTPEESDEPRPLLGKAKEWMHTTAHAAGVVDPLGGDGLAPDAPVMRELNTMPGWAGSCWYYLRYCSPKDGARFVDRGAERYWMGAKGVDLYVGGAEHAVLHLLYARFWHKVLFDLGDVSTIEPFQKLFHQGLITSFSYQRADKSLVPTDEVEERSEGQFFEKKTGEKLTQVTAKMSKSLKNVVNPDDVIAEYGADTFRLYEMYMGPLEASKPWNPRDIIGLFRFLQRLWRVAVDEETGGVRVATEPSQALERALHKLIASVGPKIDTLIFNTAIADLIQFVNEAVSASTGAGAGGGASQGTPALTRDQLARLAIVVSPFAPHIAEEIWVKLGLDGLASEQAWPAHDPAMLIESEVEMPVQVNGKLRTKLMVPAEADGAAVEKLALADEKVKAAVEGKTVRKIVVVPGRMVNIVVG